MKKNVNKLAKNVDYVLNRIFFSFVMNNYSNVVNKLYSASANNENIHLVFEITTYNLFAC